MTNKDKVTLKFNLRPEITEDFRKDIVRNFLGKEVHIIHRYRGEKGFVLEDFICIIDSRNHIPDDEPQEEVKKYQGKVYSILLEGYNLGDVEIKNDEREDLTNILADEYVGKTVEITIRVIK
jgi:hypothetical protein